MGRNKFSQHEFEVIGKLLKRKCAGTRFQQKEIRHQLRVDYDFNISDFNIQGKAFGYDELQECLEKGKIQILDDKTIEEMKEKHRQKKEHDEAVRMAEHADEIVDWKKVQEEWDAYYGKQEEETKK